ncbi:hypothetical protein [Peptostreptococcus sp. D1]|uniref:hypothetical protein n=1 Tax=Peptostreptococcus sp. D1 TaxID=72304 RepID=UPI0008E7B73F|nr:hypothetical protein [Peptostreptococcus sp. D1]SFE93670.1 hypothetical protein SAMN02910278_02111 [Peptostreptococcus sp. D1]
MKVREFKPIYKILIILLFLIVFYLLLGKIPIGKVNDNGTYSVPINDVLKISGLKLLAYNFVGYIIAPKAQLSIETEKKLKICSISFLAIFIICLLMYISNVIDLIFFLVLQPFFPILGLINGCLLGIRNINN